MAAHTVPTAGQDVSCTTVEIGSGAPDYKPRPPFESVFELPPGTRSQIERTLAGFGVFRKTQIEVLVESLIKWTNTVQRQIVQAGKLTFEEALQTCYFHLINDVKSAWFNHFEQTLEELFRSGRATILSEAKMHNLLQVKAVEDTNVQSMLPIIVLVVPIAESVRKMVDTAV